MEPSHVPCPDCGDVLLREALFAHSCDPQQRVEHTMLALRGEVLAFESLFRAFMLRNEGRFEAWLASRDVRRTA